MPRARALRGHASLGLDQPDPARAQFVRSKRLPRPGRPAVLYACQCCPSHQPKMKSYREPAQSAAAPSHGHGRGRGRRTRDHLPTPADYPQIVAALTAPSPPGPTRRPGRQASRFRPKHQSCGRDGALSASPRPAQKGLLEAAGRDERRRLRCPSLSLPVSPRKKPKEARHGQVSRRSADGRRDIQAPFRLNRPADRVEKARPFRPRMEVGYRYRASLRRNGCYGRSPPQVQPAPRRRLPPRRSHSRRSRHCDRCRAPPCACRLRGHQSQ